MLAMTDPRTRTSLQTLQSETTPAAGKRSTAKNKARYTAPDCPHGDFTSFCHMCTPAPQSSAHTALLAALQNSAIPDMVEIHKQLASVVESVRPAFDTSRRLNHQQSMVSLVRKPLPLGRDDQIEMLFLRQPIGDIHNRLLEQAFTHASKAEMHDRKAVAIAQLSGGGKTKLAVSAGMAAGRRRLVVPVVVSFASTGNNVRPTQELLVRCVDNVFGVVDNDPTKCSVWDEIVRANNIAMRVIKLFVWSYIRATQAMFDSIAKIITDRDQQCELLVRAQFSDQDQTMLMFFRRYIHIAVFKDDAKLNQLIVLWQEQCNRAFRRPGQRGTKRQNFFVIYDEVCKLEQCKGKFIHADYEKLPGRQTIAATDRLDIRRGELCDPPKKSSLFQCVTDLLYAMRLVIHDLLGKSVPQILIDTHFSLWAEVINRSSPARLQIEKWFDVKDITTTDMVEFLESHFNIPIDDELRTILNRLSGRPYFFCNTFLNKLWSALRGQAAERGTQLAKQAGIDTFNEEVQNACAKIRAVLNDPKAGIPTIPDLSGSSHQALLKQTYVHTRLGDPYRHRIDDIQHLVTRGIIRLLGNAEEEEVQAEPIVYEAMRQVFSRRDLNADIGFATMVSSLDSVIQSAAHGSKGPYGERALAWALMRFHGQTIDAFMNATRSIVSSVPSWIRRCTLELIQAKRSLVDSGLLLDMHSRGLPDAVWFPDELAGPDLLFLLRRGVQSTTQLPSSSSSLSSAAPQSQTSGKSLVFVAIQCKIDNKSDLRDAFCTVNPAMLWCRQRLRLAKQGLEPHEEVVKFFQDHPQHSTRFIRAVSRLGGFHDSLISKCNEYNSTNPQTPILLISPNERLFGSKLLESLTKLCPRTKPQNVMQPKKLMQFANPLAYRQWSPLGQTSATEEVEGPASKSPRRKTRKRRRDAGDQHPVSSTKRRMRQSVLSFARLPQEEIAQDDTTDESLLVNTTQSRERR